MPPRLRASRKALFCWHLERHEVFFFVREQSQFENRELTFGADAFLVLRLLSSHTGSSICCRRIFQLIAFRIVTPSQIGARPVGPAQHIIGPVLTLLTPPFISSQLQLATLCTFSPIPSRPFHTTFFTISPSSLVLAALACPPPRTIFIVYNGRTQIPRSTPRRRRRRLLND